MLRADIGTATRTIGPLDGTHVGPQKHLPKRLAACLVPSGRPRLEPDSAGAQGRNMGRRAKEGQQRVQDGHLEDFIELYGSSGHDVLGASWTRIPCRRARRSSSEPPPAVPADRSHSPPQQSRAGATGAAGGAPRVARHPSAEPPLPRMLGRFRLALPAAMALV